MLSLGPAAGSRVGFPGYALALALASALLALSLGLLTATVTGPQGEGAQAIDGWHRLMSGDLRALLVSSLPCAAWLVAVAAYIRSSPARAATPVDPQVPAQDEAATSPSTHLHDNMESEIPVQVRRSFRDALREDGVGLALSRHAQSAGLHAETEEAHKEDDEMLKRQMAAITLVAAGSIAACDATGSTQATSNARDSPITPPSVAQLGTGAAVPATGRTKGTMSAYLDCKAGAQGAIEMSDCITVERDRQDARLNAIYKELTNLLQGDRRTRLVEAQRAWLQLQSKDDAFESSVFDDLGQPGNLQASEREIDRIRSRANQLEQYLELVK